MEESENWQHRILKYCIWRKKNLALSFNVQVGNSVCYKMKNKNLFKSACPASSQLQNYVKFRY